PFQVSPPGHFVEVETGGVVVVRATLQADSAESADLPGERQVDGVQDQASGPGGADGEVVVAGANEAGLEGQFARADHVTIHLRGANRGGGADAGQVLRSRARLVPAGADVDQAERPAGDERQGQAGAQDLAAAFAL